MSPATQKEGEPWMPLALLALPLLGAPETGKYPRTFALTLLPSRSLPSLALGGGGGGTTGHQVAGDFSKGGSPPTGGAKVTCHLGANRALALPD